MYFSFLRQLNWHVSNMHMNCSVQAKCFSTIRVRRDCIYPYFSELDNFHVAGNTAHATSVPTAELCVERRPCCYESVHMLYRMKRKLIAVAQAECIICILPIPVVPYLFPPDFAPILNGMQLICAVHLASQQYVIFFHFFQNKIFSQRCGSFISFISGARLNFDIGFICFFFPQLLLLLFLQRREAQLLSELNKEAKRYRYLKSRERSVRNRKLIDG